MVHEAFEITWWLIGVVGVVVHAQGQRHVGLGGRRGDDHLLGARLEVLGGVVALGEQAGGLDHDLRAAVAPRESGGIALREDLQLVAVDDESVVGVVDLPLEGTQNRVVLEQVGECLGVRDVVDADPVDVGAGCVRGPEDVAADPPEAVDSGLQGHAHAPSLAGPVGR